MQCETREVGDYKIRELTLGELMDLREANANVGGNAMTFALMGAAVSNGSGNPIGVDGARAIPARMAQRISSIVMELNNVGGDEAKNA